MAKTIVEELIEKTYRELAQPKGPEARSRVWTDPEGYRYLVPWSNAALLRFLIRLQTSGLPKSEYRRKSQLDDAARSVVRNIEEGYKRATTSEYLQFIGYSQGSLEEVKGDIREMTEDRFLRTVQGSSLVGIGLDLGSFNRALRGTKGRYRNLKDGKTDDGKGKLKEGKTIDGGKPWEYRPLTVLYSPLEKVRAGDLTYEVFLELINKTDWNLRKLVESLEKKLEDGQMYWKVEQARIADKFKRR